MACRKCIFCNKEALYICPKCKISYCSSVCYKNRQHVACTELFYKQQVEELLRDSSFEPESVKKMLQILQQERTDDVSDSLDQLNLTDDSEDLTESERQLFLRMIENADIGRLIPLWKPWWKASTGKITVQTEESNSISKLSDLTRKLPSPTICFDLVNIVCSYVYFGRLYNGDFFETDCIEEVFDELIELCSVFQNNVVFQDAKTALHSFLISTNYSNSSTLLEDTIDVYDSAQHLGHALDDIRSICRQYRKVNKDAERRKNAQLIALKCNFYEAWIDEYHHLKKTAVVTALKKELEMLQNRAKEVELVDESRKPSSLLLDSNLAENTKEHVTHKSPLRTGKKLIEEL